MHNILLLNADERPFEVEAIERVFQSESGFSEIRYNEPGGALIEADFVEPEDSTIVGLNGSRSSIMLSGTSGAALRAAFILQRRLESPLRIIDTEYSFDLMLRDFATLEELQAAIEKARAG